MGKNNTQIEYPCPFQRNCNYGVFPEKGGGKIILDGNEYKCKRLFAETGDGRCAVTLALDYLHRIESKIK